MSSISYKPSYQHFHYPLTINHVAVSVLDLDEAVKWYAEVLGFNLVKPPMEGIADDSYLGRLFQDIFGKGFKKLKLAHLSFGNQVGLEVFEFIDPKRGETSKQF
jgi:catechol 2,3-dioxygenase-like lactoylglutathione lyase family enzyme